jgi:hypothetical protein
MIYSHLKLEALQSLYRSPDLQAGTCFLWHCCFFTPVSNVHLINTSAFYIYDNHDFLLVDGFIPFAVWGF